MKTTTKTIEVGQTMTAIIGGVAHAVRVLGVDSDPACAVWVAYVANPDRDAYVPRAALRASMKLTATNLFALRQWAAAGCPAAVAKVDAPHLRRCIALGLVATVNGAPVLTEAGRAAVQS